MLRWIPAFAGMTKMAGVQKSRRTTFRLDTCGADLSSKRNLRRRYTNAAKSATVSRRNAAEEKFRENLKQRTQKTAKA
jgi:hypothetical protein